MVENKAFDAEGDPRDLTLSARPITPQSQTGSNQNQIAILVLGAFVAVSLVGLVAVLVVHVQAGEQWEQGMAYYRDYVSANSPGEQGFKTDRHRIHSLCMVNVECQWMRPAISVCAP